MPDWVANSLSVYGDPIKIKEFVDEQEGTRDFGSVASKALQFNTLIPYPKNATRENIYNGDTFPTDLYDRHRCQWEKDHWGVKWGACQIERHYKENDDHVTYSSNTAWDFADKWFKTLFTKYKHLQFHIYAQANTNDFIVELDAKDGHIIKSSNAIGEEDVLQKIEIDDPIYYNQIMEDRKNE